MGKKKESKKDGKKKKKSSDDGVAALTATRDLFDALHSRRSHKSFKPTPLEREQLTVLLEAAVRAPNHKLTEPWGFIVLGPEAKKAYAYTRARIKYKGEDDEKAAHLIEEITKVPAVVGVSQKLDEDPVRREEDFAAIWMAVQNVLLAATALGLGSKVYTGRMLEDQWLRDALHITDRERLLTFIHLGEPADDMPPKKRIPAAEKTRWLP